MKNWQQRVVIEQNELSEKIHKLFTFVEDPESGISDEDRRILRLQGAVMSLYQQILRERIDSFKD